MGEEKEGGGRRGRGEGEGGKGDLWKSKDRGVNVSESIVVRRRIFIRATILGPRTFDPVCKCVCVCMRASMRMSYVAVCVRVICVCVYASIHMDIFVICTHVYLRTYIAVGHRFTRATIIGPRTLEHTIVPKISKKTKIILLKKFGLHFFLG